LIYKEDLRKEIMLENELSLKANEIRKLVIDMLYKIGPERRGHPGPALSIAEILACLYFSVMNTDSKNPKWPERDRLILSKGHACPALYAVLALKGYFEKENLYTFRKVNSILQGHPDMRKTPGIDMTAGSLGHGLAAGAGMALAGVMDRKKYKTYVIIGDGETQEGLIWESAMYAGNMKLDNLVVIIDKNRFQSCGDVCCIVDVDPLDKKFMSFNWEVVKCNGHDISSLLEAFGTPHANKPLAIIAETVKGKGVSFMEEDNSWHQKAITQEQYETAMKELHKKNSTPDQQRN